jgi:hypothetical protein
MGAIHELMYHGGPCLLYNSLVCRKPTNPLTFSIVALEALLCELHLKEVLDNFVRFMENFS